MGGWGGGGQMQRVDTAQQARVDTAGAAGQQGDAAVSAQSAVQPQQHLVGAQAHVDDAHAMQAPDGGQQRRRQERHHCRFQTAAAAAAAGRQQLQQVV
eukprot:ctg_1878.g309